MSKSHLRADKTCLNCNYVVENRFCPNCGQENIDTRKTFHHLFVHFFEDLTHYENAFWKTIKNLLLKPASLTKEYLSGKRLSYLAPVRLYIFISFVTFFLITILPSKDTSVVNFQKNKNKNEHISFNTQNPLHPVKEVIKPEELNKLDLFHFGYKTVEELDSVQKTLPEQEKLSSFEYWMTKKSIQVTEHNTTEEIIEKFKESFLHNFPKVLIFYMPLFALILWLFHNKKKWYYFDHGIFTLHYFSFLLLSFLIVYTNNIISEWIDVGWISIVLLIANFIITIWMLYYFYPAHYRFYGDKKVISFLKTSFLFCINFFIIIFILLLFAVYTFITLH